MNYELEIMTFDNCEKAYEIDRSDVPDEFVEDVQTIKSALEFGAENNLIGHAFLVKIDDKAAATIMIGEGLVDEEDPDELKIRPFYRLMFFVVDKKYRNFGLGSKIIEDAIERIYNEYGERPILISVHKENERAARFYERNGFIRTSYKYDDDIYFVRGL